MSTKSQRENDRNLEELESLRLFEARARVRPCTLAGLSALKKEVEAHVISVRNAREIRRSKSLIESETREFRSALHSLRFAIRQAEAEHAKANDEINWVHKLVENGQVYEANLVRTKTLGWKDYPDIRLDFIEEAQIKQQSREVRLVVGIFTLTGLVLGIVCLFEILHRSGKN